MRRTVLILGLCSAATACSRDVPEPPPAVVHRVTHSAPDATLFIQGILDPEGKELLRFGPVRRLNGVAKGRPVQATGRFAVRVVGSDGITAVAPFDGLVAVDPGRTRHGFFEVVVPVGGGIERIEVVDLTSEAVLGTIEGVAIEGL